MNGINSPAVLAGKNRKLSDGVREFALLGTINLSEQ
jgi:hypothetical protein